MRKLVLLALLLLPARVAAQSADSLLSAVQKLEAAGRWREAIAPLERYLQLRPGDGDRTRQLGQYLAWMGDRVRGTALLRRAAEMRPKNAETLASLGEVLSWQPAHRGEAAGLFRAALEIDPANVRAQEGEANLLAWSGRAGEALPRYDAILAAAPGNLGALRGKGGALNQLRRYQEAEQVLHQALAMDPADPGSLQELAASHAGLEEFDRAAERLREVHGQESRELRLLQDTTRRARGSYLEADGMRRTRSRQLDATRGDFRASAYLGGGARLLAGWQHTRFSDSLGGFNADLGTAGFGYRPNRHLDVEVGAGAHRTEGAAGTQWVGNAALSLRPSAAVRFSLAADRSLVEETRQSVEGSVHANLGTMGAELVLFNRRLELGGHLLGGVYSAPGLEDNTRLGADVTASVVLRSYQPYLRLGYGYMATRYDYNASTYAPTNPAQVGGYFSPHMFYVNYGSVTASQRFGERVFWEFNGSLGGQMVREQEAGQQDTRVAASVNTHLTWRAGRGTDLDLRYQYTDAFAAFRLHEVRLLLRQYF